MKIQLHCFAIAKDLVGAAQTEIELPLGSRVADLRLRLGELFPALLPILPRVRLAINSEYVHDAAILTENCEAAIIPPVSGG
jgi:molybdopterin converting factor small subunit